MLDFFPGVVKGVLSLMFYLLNTVFFCLIIFIVAFIKFSIRIKSVTRLCDRVLLVISNLWITINGINSALFNHIQWDVRGIDKLEPREWYLVLSNHQSWVDILVLQKVFNRKIPFLKFFLKKELIWVPFLGLAWWALDFPFMRRYSRSFLEKHPHLRGKDLESTQKACAKFATIPVSVMNFVEGTRFSPEKHHRQQAGFKHLLNPRAGGIAFVLNAMGESLHQIVDVTIVYPDGADSFWGFISGRIRRIIVDVEVMPVTEELNGDYFNDPAFKAFFCAWLNELWDKKDRKIGQLMVEEELN